jgi:general secretion pathway protein D
MMKVIEDLDNDTLETLRFVSYTLKNADAREIASVITSLFTEQSGATSGGGGRGQMNPQQRSQFQALARQAQGTGSGGSQPISVRTIADLRTNSVLVVCTEPQKKVIDQLVSELDRDVTDFQKIKIYTLKNADASQMSTVIRGMFSTTSTAASRSGSGLTRAVDITTDTRTNSMIVKTAEENLAVIDEVVRSLDTKPTESETTFIFHPKNANAVNIMQTIQGLLKGGVVPSSTRGPVPGGSQQGRSSQGQQGRGSNQQRGSGGDFQMQGPNVPGSSNRLGPDMQEEQDPEPQPAPPRSAQGGEGVTGRVDVQADEDTNTVIIRTSPRNMDAIRQIMAELDRFRPQVLIRVLITEVTLDKATEFGVEGTYRQANRSVKGDKIVETLATNFALGAGGFTYLLQADQFEANLRLFAREGRLRVLATPRILVLDNQEASITVGKLVPFIQSSRQTPEGSILNTIQYQDIGILLRVTPHINPDGLVTMVIHPEVSEVASASESVLISEGVLAPTFNKNAADTSVAVRHGQTIVLGGLIREFDDHAEEKIPVLGDVPILGGLFSSTTKRKVRRELMIFITPHVVYNQAELEELTELEKSKLKLIDPRDIELKGREWRALLRD